jgi:hypothetical protein
MAPLRTRVHIRRAFGAAKAATEKLDAKEIAINHSAEGATRQLLEEIVRPQHHWSFSLCWLFEELTRCSLFNRIAQPHKLIYSLICLHITRAFKIVHRGGADRTPHCLVLIEHREIDDHPIEVVA